MKIHPLNWPTVNNIIKMVFCRIFEYWIARIDVNMYNFYPQRIKKKGNNVKSRGLRLDLHLSMKVHSVVLKVRPILMRKNV